MSQNAIYNENKQFDSHNVCISTSENKIVAQSLISEKISESDNEEYNKKETESSADDKVYVCGGKYSKKFHSTSKCKGLNNCKSKIYYYDSQSAALKAGYEYCKICWK
ncbi:MAG: hypothetical protein C0596_07480 [Marinilabiliales bacterium]|nr:MAG: hypothetical protein C0596_07480 [Marinilabiliales bacterium]